MDDGTATETALDVLMVLLWAAIGLAVAALISIALTLIVRLIGSRHPNMEYVSRHMRKPQRVLLAVLGVGLGISAATSDANPSWRPTYEHALKIVIILLVAYLLSGMMRAIEDSVNARFQDAESTAHARRIRTQMQMLTRVGIAVIWICAVAGALLTFDEFRAIGASLFASAGLLSIIAGLAAQSSLTNIFAGLQIAFSDSLRVGDTVAVEDISGTVEEITLTYVVIKVWDGRRMLLPSQYFTTKVFEDWSRTDTAQLGSVDFDFDFFVPVEAVRAEVERVVRTTELWDGRTAAVSVADAVGGMLRVKVVLSAADPGQLGDLRNLVREDVVRWVQRNAPYGLPRTRIDPDVTPAPERSIREDLVEETKESLHRIERAREAKAREIIEAQRRAREQESDVSVDAAEGAARTGRKKKRRGLPRLNRRTHTGPNARVQGVTTTTGIIRSVRIEPDEDDDDHGAGAHGSARS